MYPLQDGWYSWGIFPFFYNVQSKNFYIIKQCEGTLKIYNLGLTISSVIIQNV